MFEGLETDYHMQLVEALNSVELALNKLCRHILVDLVSYPAWVAPWNAIEGVAVHEQIINALRKLDIVPGAPPGAVYSFPAVIGCRSDTITLIDKVNEKKLLFKALWAEAKKAITQEDKTAYLRRLFNKAGYTGVSLKHVMRQIHYINCQPEKISWIKTRSSSLKHISKIEAERLLFQQFGEGPHFDIQRSKLKILSPKQSLALYKPISQSYQLNYVEEGCTHKIVTSLPVFYLKENEAQPIVKFREKQGERKTRSDKRVVGDQPYLPSIGAWLLQ